MRSAKVRNSDNDQDQPRCFTCQEHRLTSNQNLHGGYLTGDLERVLNHVHQADYSIIFGINVSKATVFTSLSETLRCLTIKSFFTLQNAAERWVSSTTLGPIDCLSPVECSQHRENICKLLDFFKFCAEIFLREDLQSDSVTILHQFLCNLKCLCLTIGRISQIPEHVVAFATTGNKRYPAAHALLHMKLDFWWSLVSLYHILDSPKISANVSTEHRLHTNSNLPITDKLIGQAILLAIWDLSSLALRTFQKLQPSDFLLASPFNCSCVKEFWVLIILLLNHRKENNQDEVVSFWMYLHCITEDILSDNVVVSYESSPNLTGNSFKPENFVCSSPAEFLLWLITNLAPLWKYDSAGNYIKNGQCTSNYFEVQKLLKIILNNQDDSRTADGRKLLFAVKCCLSLTTVWEPSVELVIIFIEFFLKNMNSCHQYAKVGIEAHCLSRKSGSEWIEEIRTLLSPVEDWESTGAGSSFHLALKLMCSVLHLLPKDKLLTSWRKVSGRVFLKITRQKISDLSESGIQNMLTILLTLGCISNVKDIISKITIMANMVPAHSAKSNLMWTALFALLHNQQSRKEDLTPVAKGLFELFSGLVQLFVKSDKDHIVRHAIQIQINLYLKELQDIIANSSDLALSEHLFFGEPFCQLLSVCGVSEISAILVTVLSAIERLRNIREDLSRRLHNCLIPSASESFKMHETLVSQLYHSVMPFLEVHGKTQTPPDLLAHVAAGFTLLAADGFSLPKKENISTLMTKFALSTGINSRIRCIFLCHVLTEQEVLGQLSCSQQKSILDIWLRSTLSCVTKNEEMEALGRLVAGLPEISQKFPDLLTVTSINGHHDFMVIGFFRSLFNQWQQCESLQSRALIQRFFMECFNGFVAEIKFLMKENSSSELVNHVIMLTGYFVFYCSQLVYSMGRPDCLLPSILENTVLPITFLKDVPLPPSMFNACKEYLHLYIQGLIQHNFKSDPYIARKLRGLVNFYLPKFPLSSGNVHPLLNFVSEGTISKDKIDNILFFIVETVCERFLIKKGPDLSPHLQAALQFTSEVLILASPRSKIKIACSLCTPLLEIYLLHPPNVGASNSRLQEMLTSVIKLTEETEESRSKCLESLLTVTEHHLAWKSKMVFLCLERLSILCPNLLTKFRPSLMKMVEALEEKRGMGMDKSLREGLANVMKKLEAVK